MANNLSDYAEVALMDWLMTTNSVTRPTSWYVALFTTATADDGTGTEVGAGVGYSRQAVTFASTTSPTGNTSNTNTLTFGPCSTTNWGTITHAAVYNNSSGGNMLWQGALNSPRTIQVGDSFQIPIGQLTLTLA